MIPSCHVNLGVRRSKITCNFEVPGWLGLLLKVMLTLPNLLAESTCQSLPSLTPPSGERMRESGVERNGRSAACCFLPLPVMASGLALDDHCWPPACKSWRDSLSVRVLHTPLAKKLGQNPSPTRSVLLELFFNLLGKFSQDVKLLEQIYSDGCISKTVCLFLPPRS